METCERGQAIRAQSADNMTSGCYGPHEAKVRGLGQVSLPRSQVTAEMGGGGGDRRRKESGG